MYVLWFIYVCFVVCRVYIYMVYMYVHGVVGCVCICSMSVHVCGVCSGSTCMGDAYGVYKCVMCIYGCMMGVYSVYRYMGSMFCVGVWCMYVSRWYIRMVCM